MRRFTVPLLLLLLAVPATAGAATVTFSKGRTRFVDTKGEVNRLRVSLDDSGRHDVTVLRDRTARLVARGRCRSEDAHTVRCPYDYEPVEAQLGGRDDQAYWNGDFIDKAPLRFDGGPGDDVLKGSFDDDVLVGGPGKDRLLGGNGADLLVDGEGRGKHSADVFRGGNSGSGNSNSRAGDRLDYGDRTDDLRIVLGDTSGYIEDATSDVEDTISDIEQVRGGTGDDELTGDNDDNVLIGGAGDDVLDGGAYGEDVLSGGAGADRLAGNEFADRLSGGPGADVLDGGAGDDQLLAFGDGTADTLTCGDGEDGIESEPADTVTGCERFDALAHGDDTSADAAVLPSVGAGSATLQAFRCFAAKESCRGTVTLTGLAGEAYGTTPFGVGATKGDGASLAVPLTPAGVAALVPGAALVVAVAADEQSAPDRGTRGYRLVLP